jgi:hypothetical protein
MKSRLLTLVLATAILTLLAPATASASGYVKYGIQDDAWLASGPGTLEQRLDTLQRLGVSIVRYTIRWDRVAAKRPRNARSHGDAAYEWGVADAVLRGLRAHGIEAVVTIYGAPRWTNGRRAPNWAPRSGSTTASFSYAAARRYSWVRRWLVWNEPNQRIWLRPTAASTYTRRLLNPAYAAIHAANRRAAVGGGVTAPRGNAGGVSPVDWIRGMRAAGARLDAFAHNPYPLNPRSETPTRGGCSHCKTITMATLERLVAEVTRSFGQKRIWLTEYGYQTNPPDRWLGVSPALQARYHAEAALRVYHAARVDMLIHFLVRDEPIVGRWQSGLIGINGVAKPSYRAFMLPLAQVSRRGLRTVLWGQVRPRAGRQTYRLQQFRSGRWRWVGGVVRTNARGFYQRTVRAGGGARFRIWSPRDRVYGPVVVVR